MIREPLRETLDQRPATLPASFGGQDALDAQRPHPKPLRMPRQEEKHPSRPATDAAAASRPPAFTRALAPAGSPESDAGSTSMTKAAEEKQHGHQIQQPLQDDGREARRRAAAPPLLRERGTAAALPRRAPAGESSPRSRSPSFRKATRNRRRPDRGQQVLPAERARADVIIVTNTPGDGVIAGSA